MHFVHGSCIFNSVDYKITLINDHSGDLKAYRARPEGFYLLHSDEVWLVLFLVTVMGALFL